MNKTRTIIMMGLFIALGIILTRLVKPIDTPFVRVSFGFIATSLSSIVIGPVLSGVVAAFSDIIGFFMFPSSAPFFPGFTLSALLTGVIYGIFMYKKSLSMIRVILAVLIVSIVIDLGLNTLWLAILYQKAWIAIITGRLIKTAIMFPIQAALIYATWRYLGKFIERNLIK